MRLARAKAEVIEDGVGEVISDAWPKRTMPVLFQGEKRTLGMMRWGFWWYNHKLKKPTFVTNARNDAIGKAIWKSASEYGRCLVPADGFFEPTGPKGAMWEVLFHLKEEEPFWFPGLWAKDPEGSDRGFAFMTTEPNELLAALPHDRMPVILNDEQAEAWIGNKPVAREHLLSLCKPIAASALIRTDMPPLARGVTTLKAVKSDGEQLPLL